MLKLTNYINIQVPTPANHCWQRISHTRLRLFSYKLFQEIYGPGWQRGLPLWCLSQSFCMSWILKRVRKEFIPVSLFLFLVICIHVCYRVFNGVTTPFLLPHLWGPELSRVGSIPISSSHYENFSILLCGVAPGVRAHGWWVHRPYNSWVHPHSWHLAITGEPMQLSLVDELPGGSFGASLFPRQGLTQELFLRVWFLLAVYHEQSLPSWIFISSHLGSLPRKSWLQRGPL